MRTKNFLSYFILLLGGMGFLSDEAVTARGAAAVVSFS